MLRTCVTRGVHNGVVAARREQGLGSASASHHAPATLLNLMVIRQRSKGEGISSTTSGRSPARDLAEEPLPDHSNLQDSGHVKRTGGQYVVATVRRPH
jgi:hypothetical protein